MGYQRQEATETHWSGRWRRSDLAAMLEVGVDSGHDDDDETKVDDESWSTSISTTSSDRGDGKTRKPEEDGGRSIFESKWDVGGQVAEHEKISCVLVRCVAIP